MCSVTGSSHAGLLVGSLIEKFEGKRQRKIIGIDASGKVDKTRAQVMKIAQDTCEMLGLPPVEEDELILDDRFNAGIYGLADEATLKAIKTGAECDAFVRSLPVSPALARPPPKTDHQPPSRSLLSPQITDPVYEGKSLAGLIKLVGDREIPADSCVSSPEFYPRRPRTDPNLSSTTSTSLS